MTIGAVYARDLLSSPGVNTTTHSPGVSGERRSQPNWKPVYEAAPSKPYIGHTDCPTLVTRDQQVQVGARPLVESEGPEAQGLAAGRLALLLYFSSFPRRGRSVN